MSDEHDHSAQDHGHDHGPEKPAPTPQPVVIEDAGSRALGEALKSSFYIIRVVMIFMLGYFLFSGLFKVGPQQRAIILRFGAPVGTENNALLGAGLHWAFPYPIDEVVRIPYHEIQQVKSTVGWYFTTPEKEALGTEDSPGASLNPAMDGYVITGDGNIIHTRATLYYRVQDSKRYEFDFVNASNAVQNALDNALIYAASRFQVDNALTRERLQFSELVRARVEELIAKERLGIAIDHCSVDAIPPRQLKQPFDSVLTAVSIRDKMLNEARSYQNQVTNRAAGDATGIINAAHAESVALLESVKAEAKRFSDLLPLYKANPELTANILLSEAFGQVLTNAQEKWYIPDRADGKPWEIRLQLSREPPSKATNAPGTPAP